MVQVRALNRDGDSIPGAVIVLVSLNPDTVAIDSARMAVVGKAIGPAKVFARTGNLPSDPFTILVK